MVETSSVDVLPTKYLRKTRVKASQLHPFCPYATVYCNIEFKLNYLKNKISFSIRVKELFEPTVL